jgi:hypothetical protein
MQQFDSDPQIGKLRVLQLTNSFSRAPSFFPYAANSIRAAADSSRLREAQVLPALNDWPLLPEETKADAAREWVSRPRRRQ